jgi:hypothetical protein
MVVGWQDRNSVTLSLLAVRSNFVVRCMGDVYASGWQYQFDDIATRCHVVLRNLRSVLMQQYDRDDQ